MTTHAKDGRAELLRRAIRLKQAAACSRTPRLPSRPVDEPARLGELQRSLWLLQQLEPSSPAYNLTSAFRVPGELSVGSLERGLNSVVARHRLLRSTFRADGDSALQIVHDRSEAGAGQVLVEQLTVGQGEALDTAVREARKPFDLEAGPLIRLLLIEETSADGRLLVLVLHHILADERSLGRLWRELAEVYDGAEPDAPELPQYDDYVHWLASQDHQSREGELAHWRRCLDPLPDDLRLSFERPARGRSIGDGARSRRGRLLSLALGPEIAQGIRRVASATETTPFAVFAFAFRLLLHRYSQGQDIAFATPVSRRSHPATAEMLGYFLNPVVIRGLIDEQHSVERAIRAFGLTIRDSMAHASVSFDVLVETLAPPRQRDRQPIFQTMFVYQEMPPPPQLGGLKLEPITLDLGESKFDLTLFVSELAPKSGAALEVAVEFRADRFDAIWMHNLLGHYETLVGNLADGLERPAAEVPMLRPEEQGKLGEGARGAPLAALDGAEESLLPRQILDQARRAKSAPALIGGDQDWSYGDLERVAGAIARELTRRGVKPGDRVGLFLDRCPLMIAGVLGCHWAGAAYVPLDPAYPSARNRDVLEDAEVSAVLVRSALRDRLPGGSWPTIDIGGFEEHRSENGGSEPPAAPDLRAEHPAYILYTSGSTGRPKGVVISHGNLRASNGARFQYYDLPPKRFLLLPSIAFDSSVVGIFWTLAAGGALVIPTDDEARDPRQLARLVTENQVTSLLCVPSLYAHILAAVGDRSRHLESVIVAGESCPSQLVREHFRHLPKARLFNEYGPTEATVWATVHEFEPGETDDSAGRGPTAIGRPIPGVRVEVLDSLGRRVPAGIPGQGWISGPTVAEGYWRRPDLTAECFVRRDIEIGPGAVEQAKPMYRTGDRLAWRADGRLLFLGRIDDQIKLRGFRIEPGEIEAALLEIPEIEEAAVVARAEAQLVAFVETTGTETRATRAWRAELKQRLPEFMVPGRIVELPAIPRLPNGKIDRGRLRAMELDAVETARTDDEPLILDERQQALTSLWQGLLGRTGIGPDDNFFQLGGHSLLVVEMASAIERDFGAVLAPAEVFQHPTIRQLAQRIEQDGGLGAPTYGHLFPIQPGGRESPFIFSVPHFFSEMVATRFRGERPVYGLRGVSLRPEGNRGRWRTMRDLGEELVDEVHHRFSGETCIMAGYSFGASMAVEAVRLMEERGMPVKCLILIAPMPVDVYRFGPLLAQLDGLRQPVDELSLLQALRHFARDNHPLTLRPYRRLWRLLAIQPWRRLLCLSGKLRSLAGLPLTPKILHADVRLERFRLHARYRPGVLRTPTVIFNAKEPATDAAATWRPYFEGPLTVHATPDPHLDAAHVQSAKDLILDRLGRYL